MSSDGARLSTAYCSARDRVIPVLVKPGSWEGRVPSPRDAMEAVTCLDYGVRCTGWLCPLFSLPSLPAEELLQEAVAAERLRRERTLAARKKPSAGGRDAGADWVPSP